MEIAMKVMSLRLVTLGKISDFINCTYLSSTGSLWIPSLFLNGLPWLNKVTYLLTYLLPKIHFVTSIAMKQFHSWD